MAILAKSDTKEKKNYYQDLFLPNTLSAIKPRTDSITVIRPIPEVDQDGNFIPMVKTMTVGGADFSNITLESILINAGQSLKYTGVCRAVEQEAEDPFAMVFSALYIKLKSKEKKNELPPELDTKIRSLLADRDIPNSKMKEKILKRPQDIGLIQCVALTVNGTNLERPAVKQAVIMSKGLLDHMNDVLTDCYNKKIDVFSPKSGHALVIKGLPPDPKIGRQIAIFTVELGKQVALPEDRCKSLWVPWQTAIKRLTYDQQIVQAVRCYGRDVVHVIFPDDVDRLVPSSAVVGKGVSAPAAPPAVAKAAPAAPPIVVEGSTLDLSGAIDTAVDEGAGEDDDAAAPAASTVSNVKPANPATLASEYENVLKNL